MNELDVLLCPLPELCDLLGTCMADNWHATAVRAVKYRADYRDWVIKHTNGAGSGWVESFDLACQEAGYAAVWSGRDPYKNTLTGLVKINKDAKREDKYK